jgi:hypothetical protein
LIVAVGFGSGMAYASHAAKRRHATLEREMPGKSGKAQRVLSRLFFAASWACPFSNRHQSLRRGPAFFRRFAAGGSALCELLGLRLISPVLGLAIDDCITLTRYELSEETRRSFRDYAPAQPRCMK